MRGYICVHISDAAPSGSKNYRKALHTVFIRTKALPFPAHTLKHLEATVRIWNSLVDTGHLEAICVQAVFYSLLHWQCESLLRSLTICSFSLQQATSSLQIKLTRDGWMPLAETTGRASTRVRLCIHCQFETRFYGSRSSPALPRKIRLLFLLQVLHQLL